MMPDEERGPRATSRGAVLQLLKVETHAMHERIESVVPLLRPGLKLSQYGHYLKRLLGYYRPLERQLAGFSGELALSGFDFTERLKTKFLEQDLAALQMNSGEIADAPDCRFLPRTDTLASAWGVLYVLEGSTLGGQILSRRLRDALGLETSSGARFLNPYGERTGSMWKGFAGALSGWSRSESSDSQVVLAAQQTFTTLTAWLEERQDGRGTVGA